MNRAALILSLAASPVFAAGHQIVFTPVECPDGQTCNRISIDVTRSNGTTAQISIPTKLRFSTSEIRVITGNGEVVIRSPK